MSKKLKNWQYRPLAHLLFILHYLSFGKWHQRLNESSMHTLGGKHRIQLLWLFVCTEGRNITYNLWVGSMYFLLETLRKKAAHNVKKDQINYQSKVLLIKKGPLYSKTKLIVRMKSTPNVKERNKNNLAQEDTRRLIWLVSYSSKQRCHVSLHSADCCIAKLLHRLKGGRHY